MSAWTSLLQCVLSKSPRARTHTYHSSSSREVKYFRIALLWRYFLQTIIKNETYLHSGSIEDIKKTSGTALFVQKTTQTSLKLFTFTGNPEASFFSTSWQVDDNQIDSNQRKGTYTLPRVKCVNVNCNGSKTIMLLMNWKHESKTFFFLFIKTIKSLSCRPKNKQKL